jgi:hypothetical protein
MLRKFAGALLAATIFVAPAFAGEGSKNASPAAPAVAATQPVKSDVKAASTASPIKKSKHARKHVRSHIAKHGTSVKHVKAAKSLSKVSRIKTSKRIHAKVHARSHIQAAAKPVTKTGTN